MMATQYLVPSQRPIAADGGCSSTKVMKKSDTARLRSSGEAPISVLKPEACIQLRATSPLLLCEAYLGSQHFPHLIGPTR